MKPSIKDGNQGTKHMKIYWITIQTGSVVYENNVKVSLYCSKKISNTELQLTVLLMVEEYPHISH